MKRPTPPPDDVRDLIAQCLQLREESGPGAVDELLERHPETSDLVRERLDLLGRMGLVGGSPEEAQPERIGEYRIVGVLGRGGMGVVYEAEQERPRRRVALKVLRAWPGEKGRLRFELEAELLAQLQHPGIATIHEAGTAAVGGMTVPFFAMELVRGVSLDRFARKQELSTRARIELLARIADAVHHAHLKGIVHRDLKPANVMIDESGRPVVLDFGVARAVDPDLRVETLRTEAGQLVGTLAYMSPEQAAGDPSAIDSRCDVYSLGVIGYELLAGKLPLEVHGCSALEALERIRDEEPPLLGKLDPGLRGDLETIFAVALAKAPERRYESAHELASELRRHLADEPITARAATPSYQLLKFARRNRALVAGAAAVLVALLLGLAGTLHGLVRASAERDDAEARFQQASALLDFQARMFAQADPQQEGVRVEELLDGGLLLLEQVGGDPVQGAAIRLMLGKAWRGIGAFAEALPLMAEAAATFEEHLGAEDLQTLSAQIELASLLGHPLGRLDDAMDALDGVAETASRVHGADNPLTLHAQLVREELYFERGQFQEAIDLGLEIEARAVPDSLEQIIARQWMAKAYESQGQRPKALVLIEGVLEWHLEHLGREHPNTWTVMSAYGLMLQQAGRMAESKPILDELIELCTENLGPRHPRTLDARVLSSMPLSFSGELEEQERILLEVLEICDQDFAPDHPARLSALAHLASVHLAMNRPEQAEEVAWEAFELMNAMFGPEHPNTTRQMGSLANILRNIGQPEEAEGLLVEAVAIQRRTVGNKHPETISSLSSLGDFYSLELRAAQGEPFHREALELSREVLPPGHFSIAAYILGLAQNLLMQRQYEEAEQLLAECGEFGEKLGPSGSPANRKLRELLGVLEANRDRPTVSEAPDESQPDEGQ